MQNSPSEDRRDEVRAFWTGPQLSPYEILSLLSFVATGARVKLYTKDKTLLVPDGVEVFDVSELLPQETHRFSYEDGDQCLTPHSDLFRYIAIEQFGGWYADLDIVCLRDTLPQSKVYIAREFDDLVNAAVMKFPAQAPILTAAIEEAQRLWPQAGRLTIGPELFSQLIEEYALGHLVLPRSSAYEIGTTEILAMFDPQTREALEERISKSDFFHFWNEIWRRIRIPKMYGPPEGSFLDGLFRRFDIRFPADARLSVDAINTWMRERHLLAQVAARLDTESVPASAMGLLMQQFRQRGASAYVALRPEKSAKESQKSVNSQVVRTLWHGPSIGPYQLMCLRSFVDRGHQVEVFSYDPTLTLPRWLRRRHGSEIIESDKVIRCLPDQEQVAIHASLFRCAMLHRLGGWWIDPDVVLLSDVLPRDSPFIAGPREFEIVSTAAMNFPAGHPTLADALQKLTSLDQSIGNWDRSGDLVLSQALSVHDDRGIGVATSALPLSWLDVTKLFDPAQADEVEQNCRDQLFLDLHYDVWLRAGIPSYLGPPPNSFLDRLFQRHTIGFQFSEYMEFPDVRRWLFHMYKALP